MPPWTEFRLDSASGRLGHHRLEDELDARRLKGVLDGIRIGYRH